MLQDLPPEILFEILLCLPPTSIPAFQQTCSKVNDLSQPVLWGYHCQRLYKYWRPEHDIARKLAQPTANVNWKYIFSVRHLADLSVSRALEDILSSQVCRLDKSENIFAQGYDAKDTLLKHLKVGDDAPDALARRFYSDAALGGLHRSMAIEEWVKLRDGHPVPLERALAAFDHFIMHERKADFEETSARLDEIAQSIRQETLNFAEATPQLKAKMVAAYLHENRVTGVTDNDQYFNLRNSFIGLALQDDGPAALPLISTVIFCAVLERLGVSAKPCNFPFHIYAIVKAPIEHISDSEPVTAESEVDSIYMDPFASEKEVSRGELEAQLEAMGVPPTDHDSFLGVASVSDMVRRTARNIVGSIQRNAHGPNHHDQLMGAGSGTRGLESDSALYSALWAFLVLPEPDTGLVQRARYLPYVVEMLEKQYLFDVRLVEKYLLPLFTTSPQYWQQLRDAVRVMRAGDSMPKQAKPRTREISQSVRFKVGQVFRHRRYGYQAVITGWDVECAQSEMWISQMGVDRLSRGRHQSFYNVLSVAEKLFQLSCCLRQLTGFSVDEKSVRYVAEENIDTTSAVVSPALMSLAGRHFKRWDSTSNVFVSNVKDEYPDD
ncbi:MAG: hypothetical protein Q9174_000499 [Haloplaca sp. 1 TL-2023]